MYFRTIEDTSPSRNFAAQKQYTAVANVNEDYENAEVCPNHFIFDICYVNFSSKTPAFRVQDVKVLPEIPCFVSYTSSDKKIPEIQKSFI